VGIGLKMVISISMAKNASDVLQLRKRTNCGKMGKIVENDEKYLINLYCNLHRFIVIKKLQKIGKNFCIDLTFSDVEYNGNHR